MQNRIVLITGAGFSAPAKLPVQDKILDEMVGASVDNLVEMGLPVKESRKFLTAYINVAIYLLKVYGNVDTREIEKEYTVLTQDYRADERVLTVLQYIQKTYNDEADIREFNLREILDETAKKYIIETDAYSYGLLRLKEKLRRLLLENKVRISLEDVFTTFDKSISMRENTQNYSYLQMDILHHSLLRLFVYYFSNKISRHDYKSKAYEDVIFFLKKEMKNISVITTNWDILLEQYMQKNGVSYDYAFNSEYVIHTTGKNREDRGKLGEAIEFLKIHGSINWFRCLRCGTLQVCAMDECGQYFFDDLKEEKCEKCGQTAYEEQIQLKPEIITPTMLKSINSQLYNNLWHNAAHQLQSADKVIFCGYSLPVADFEFRYLLKQNISPKAQIDVVLYHNDNPEKFFDEGSKIELLPEKRFKDLFSGNKCTFYYEGFGEYFKNLLTKLSEK